jgi:hypothetical protein
MGRKRTGGGNEDRKIKLDDAKIQLWFSEGKTAVEIAAIMGCSTPPIQAAFKKLGLKRPAKQRPGVLAGKNNPAWNGGKSIRSDGYVRVWTPNGQRLEHQVVMEEVIGRALLPMEVVHHLDENKANNDPSNLQLTTQSEHIKEHLPDMRASRYKK